MSSGEWHRLRVYRKLNKDLKQTAKRADEKIFTITELGNSPEEYPYLLPTLLKWIVHVDELARFDDAKDRADFLDGIFRARITPGARELGTMDVAYRYLLGNGGLDSYSLQGPALCASHMATVEDAAKMVELAQIRELGEHRVWIVGWLVDQRDPELLEVALGELDDPTVTPHILRQLRRYSVFPDGLAERVETFLDAELKATRKEARLLLKKMS